MSLRDKLPHFVIAVPAPSYDYTTLPLGGTPGFVPPCTPGIPQAPPKFTLVIPGTPYLISRGKKGFFNRMIDHFGLVFSTGHDRWPLPNDIVFELQADTNHEHTPLSYDEFCGGEKPHFYDVDFGSKEEVIRRLEKFWDKPKKYRPFLYNCETFAREIMTGIPECKQIDNAIEMTQVIAEVAGQMLLKMAEMHQQMQAAEEAKRQQAAVVAVAASPSASMPEPPPAQVQQVAVPTIPPTPKPKVARKPAAKKSKAAPKQRKTR